jgi:hypothetical protein
MYRIAFRSGEASIQQLERKINLLENALEAKGIMNRVVDPDPDWIRIQSG